MAQNTPPADIQCTNDEIISPTADSFEQGGNSYNVSFLWTCSVNFDKMAQLSFTKSKNLKLPFVKNEIIYFLFIKDTADEFSFHLLRMPANPKTMFRGVRMGVTFSLIGSAKPYVRKTLLPEDTSVHVSYDLCDVIPGKAAVKADWTIRCSIEIEDVYEQVDLKQEFIIDSDDNHRHMKQMKIDMEKLFLARDKYYNVILRSEIRFNAHDLILASASKYFYEKLQSTSQNPPSGILRIRSIPEKIMILILRYIYTQEIKIHSKNVFDLMYHAKSYELDELVKKCINFLRANFRLEDADYVLELAKQHRDEDLRKRADICLRGKEA